MATQAKRRRSQAKDSATSSGAKIQLPPPKDIPGASRSVFDALGARCTTRDLASTELSLQVISNVVWAAAGINRPDGPAGGNKYIPPGRKHHWGAGKTAASASNSQEVELYFINKDGVYFYHDAAHELLLKAAGDFRQFALTPKQSGGVSAKAPMHLVFVANIDRLEHTQGFNEPTLHDPEGQKSYFFTDGGIMAGNVYLICASMGLGCWFHNCDREQFKKLMELGENHRVLFAQSVGEML